MASATDTETDVYGPAPSLEAGDRVSVPITPRHRAEGEIRKVRWEPQFNRGDPWRVVVDADSGATLVATPAEIRHL